MTSQSSKSLSRQSIFFVTGSVAGICSSTADYAFDRVSSAILGTNSRTMSALIYGMLPHIIKPGIRFWAFDLTKSAITTEIPVAVRGGLAGAVGGALEMGLTTVYNHYTAAKPVSFQNDLRITLLHSAKLFLCFGSYTYLASTFSDILPPRPFPYCFLLGALAGGFGTTMITPAEVYSATRMPLKFGQVLKSALTRAPRGAVGVGTVISVQVTSSAWMLGGL